MGKFIDLAGRVIGRWTVIEKVGKSTNNGTTWLCKCKCGTERVVSSNSLLMGNSNSCGCLRNELAHKRCGPNSALWGGGVTIEKGYVYLYKPNHPNANYRGRVAEHVYVMSEYLGRPLIKGETVHHRNGIRGQNNIENLELWSGSHPCGQRVSDLIIWAKELLIKYESVINKL